MNKGIHLLMPMGGAGSRFFSDGYITPKPLIEINGKPFFYWAVKSILYSIMPIDITFVVLERHVYKYDIIKIIQNFFSDAKIITIPEVLPGAVFTARVGVDSYKDDNPIIINDCDHIFICNKIKKELLNEVETLDGALITFESNSSNYSYVKYDDGYITGTVEKQVCSNRAICGAYYFRNKTVFINIMDDYITRCPYSECFISGMYNIMCEKKMTVKDYLLDCHVEFGTPQEYKNAIGATIFDKVEQGNL